MQAYQLRAVFILLPLLHQRFAYLAQLLHGVTALINQHHLRPLLAEQQFALADAPNAHRYLESGQVRGKVIITDF